MKYQLIENYFHTELFQTTVQDYFDTVLGRIIANDATLSAKGLYIVDGKVKRDYYDMPYHIHILNGLIPALFVYEKYLQEKGWAEDTEMNLYLRIFILGFTFHDANKLLHTQQTKDRSDLEVAVAELDNHVDKWEVKKFLPDFETHKGTIYFLALSTEDGTAVASGDYKISVNNWKQINEIQRELCHLADGLASIQNEHLESIEALFRAIDKNLNKITRTAELPISYVKVRPNPYTLLSQNLLQVAKKTLRKNGKPVLYATREGFIYWGEDISDEEFEAIKNAYLVGSEDDIKFLKLTKITAQKCKFGFIGSAFFTVNILEEITTELGDRFLALSPNGDKTISDFAGFVELTKQLIASYEIPIEYEVKDDKLTLRYYEKIEEEEGIFRTVYNLHKIQWLNTKENSVWKSDLDGWINSDADLPESIEFENGGELIKLNAVSNLLHFINERVKSTDALYKTYLNFIKTYQAIKDTDDIEEYIADLQNNIISAFSPERSGNDVKQVLFDRYFECRGNTNLRFLETYDPSIPIKKQMCAFTGSLGRVDYKAEVAFAMKARGFSNRTITALNNNTSHISELFSEENKLRASQFKVADANLVVYHDFFEAKLDIDREIIHACVEAKNELHLLKDGTIQFDKNAKFQYTLYDLEFIKLAPKVEPAFFLVRKCLRMVQELGLRSYIAGIMTPYQPHKAVFHFENAPRFLKLLGWDSVRLVEVEEVLDEMRLVLTFGKNRIESNMLKIATESDLVITNPDLINYAMHGGYHQWAHHNKTGATRFSSFLDKFNYIIFDEYHLYDEAQIANILTLVKLREYFLPHYGVSKGNIHGVRFFFVSATPEEGLKKIIGNEGYEYEEIIEKIVNKSTNARPIHGTLEVEFVDCKDIKALIRAKIPELQEVIKTQKVLLILDKLRDVQELAEELKSTFEGYTIYQSTGYVSKSENHNEKIKVANLIIATNKAEVGVNYDVEYCIMQPGKHFQNFVQRFGRVSRGDLDGKIVVYVEKKYNKLKRLFREIESIGYYDFLGEMRSQLQGKRFYTERVPMYLGEYFWCIQNSIRKYQEFDVGRYLNRRMNEEGFYEGILYRRYRLFKEIDDIIREMVMSSLKLSTLSRTEKILKERGVYKQLEKRAPRTWQWVSWWKNYLDTFLTFRDGSKVVKIYDRKVGEELEYSLDWIIQHKAIEQLEILQTEPYEVVRYTVGNFKEQDKDIQYTVSTLPNAGMERNNLLSYNDLFDLDKAFKHSVERIYDKVKKGDEEIDELQAALCKQIIHLALTFDRKRLKIEAIENNNMFI